MSHSLNVTLTYLAQIPGVTALDDITDGGQGRSLAGPAHLISFSLPVHAGYMGDVLVDVVTVH